MISFHLTQVFEQFDKSFKLVNSSKIKTKISVGKLFIFAIHRNSFFDNIKKKSESLQTEGRHFRSMICKLSDV